MGYSTRSKGKLAAPAPVKSLEKKKATPAPPKASKAKTKPTGRLSSFPDVPVLNEKGEEVMSGSICAETNVVVFLYPRANTPGCTKQACGLNDNYAKLQEHGFAVCGLSYDSPKSQTNWANKYSLKFSFMCDTRNGDLIKKLGCSKPPKSIKRSHFVVAKGGKILDAQIQVSPGDSIAKAVEFVVSYEGNSADSGQDTGETVDAKGDSTTDAKMGDEKANATGEEVKDNGKHAAEKAGATELAA